MKPTGMKPTGMKPTGMKPTGKKNPSPEQMKMSMTAKLMMIKSLKMNVAQLFLYKETIHSKYLTSIYVHFHVAENCHALD